MEKYLITILILTGFVSVSFSKSSRSTKKKEVLVQLKMSYGGQRHLYELKKPRGQKSYQVSFRVDRGKIKFKKLPARYGQFILAEANQLLWEGLFREPASKAKICNRPIAKLQVLGDRTAFCGEKRITDGRLLGLANRFGSFFK